MDRNQFLAEKALEVHIAEYTALRHELAKMLDYQAQLVLAMLLALGASIPFMIDLLSREIWIALLVAPLLFTTMGWVYCGYLGLMYRVGIYIEKHLRPEINKLLESFDGGSNFNLLSWPKYSRQNELITFPFAKGFEAIVFVLPSLGSLLIFLFLHKTIGFPLEQGTKILLAFDILFVLGSLLLTAYTAFRGVKMMLEE